MRVSSYQLLDSSIRALQQQSVDALKWQRQVSTGNKFQKASQGAVALSRGVEIEFTQSRYAMHKENQAYVAGMLSAADQQLGDALTAINQLKAVGVRASNGSMGKVGLTALAAEARVAYEALEQLALATDASGKRIVLDNTTLPKFSAPRVSVTPSSSGVINTGITVTTTAGSVPEGKYEFEIASAVTGVGTTANVDVNINGGATITGEYDPNTGSISFPVGTETITFSKVSVDEDPLGSKFSLEVDSSSAVSHTKVISGAVNTGIALADNVVFQRPGSYEFTIGSSGYEALGKTLARVELKINGVGPQGKTDAGDVYTGTYYKEAGKIVMDMAPATFANLTFSSVGSEALGAKFSLQADPLQAKVSDTARLHASGDYQIKLVNFDDYETSSSPPEVAAYLYRNGALVLDSSNNPVKLTDGAGITRVQDTATGITTTTLNFGASATNPAAFRNFAVTLTGDVTKLASVEFVDFTVNDSVRAPEVEPGVTIAAGIGWNQAFGDGTDQTVDVLFEAQRFVTALENSASSGVLDPSVATYMNRLEAGHTQVLNAQVLSGALGARLDQAVEALESKSTELEAFRSRLLDADIAEASAGLVRAQTLLEAARSIFTRLEATNLFQKLI